jgi:hypothetical protein
MAGTVTVSYEVKNVGDKKLKIVTASFVADAADGSIPNTTISGLYGYLVKVITNPGATAPTDNYDVKLLDAQDSTVDALADAALNRDTANSEQVVPSVAPILAGDYTLNITNNSVNSATGTVLLFILE